MHNCNFNSIANIALALNSGPIVYIVSRLPLS